MSEITDIIGMGVDETTGGRKQIKPCQLGAIDPDALWQLGLVAGHGTLKYDQWNYLKGYSWSWSYNALNRHALRFWAGEDWDDESGLLHTAHVAWHALALTSFRLHDLGSDDRAYTIMRKKGDE